MKLEVKNLNVSIKNKRILSNINISLINGDSLAVLGGNGTGKSTLCRAIACLCNEEYMISGEIIIDNKIINNMSLAERVKYIGIITQNPETQLFAQTVEDELAFGPENLCLKRDEIEKRITYALKICGIEKLRYSLKDKLSGGEKQLVAIASILVMQPKVIIADEITSHLDKKGRENIINYYKAFTQAGGILICVSHIKNELSFCNKVLNLNSELEINNN